MDAVGEQRFDCVHVPPMAGCFHPAGPQLDRKYAVALGFWFLFHFPSQPSWLATFATWDRLESLAFVEERRSFHSGCIPFHGLGHWNLPGNRHLLANGHWGLFRCIERAERSTHSLVPLFFDFQKMSLLVKFGFMLFVDMEVV